MSIGWFGVAHRLDWCELTTYRLVFPKICRRGQKDGCAPIGAEIEYW